MSDSDNPLAPLSDEQIERIRERAYFMWIDDGCPDGQADEYWERARELQAMADHAGAGLLPNPASGPDARPGLEQPIEEASIQDNLGEFPDRVADQGDRRATPMTRDAEREWAKQA